MKTLPVYSYILMTNGLNSHSVSYRNKLCETSFRAVGLSGLNCKIWYACTSLPDIEESSVLYLTSITRYRLSFPARRSGMW